MSISSDAFSVLPNGADPNGGGDSTAAFRTTIAQAWANVQSTGRESFVDMHGGRYNLTGKTVRQHLGLVGMHGITFRGEGSRLQLTGSAGAGDWYLFAVQGGSFDIAFSDIELDMDITDADPAHQNHLVQVGPGARNIRFHNVTFNHAIGDGLRLVGDFGVPVDTVTLTGSNRFLNCSRSGISIQRWVRNVTAVGSCSFWNGADQQLDVEPTGYTLHADAGGTSITLIDAQARFVSWGVKVGDPIFDATTYALVTVRSVNSETQLTTTPVPTWAGTSYTLPMHCSGHLFDGLRFYRGTNVNDILVTQSGVYGSTFTNCHVEGTINASVSMMRSKITHCHVGNYASSTGGVRLIELQGSIIDVDVSHNSLTLNADPSTTLRTGVHVQAQGGMPDDVRIEHNTIRANCRATAVNCGASRATVSHNTAILDTPGETTFSTAFELGNTKSLVAVDNKICAQNGKWLVGYNVAALGLCVVGSGSIENCGTPIKFHEKSGTFTRIPAVVIGVIDGGDIIAPNSIPWIAIGGMPGGLAPAVFSGTGSPESVVAANVGSIATRKDTGEMYVKVSGTGATGWLLC